MKFNKEAYLKRIKVAEPLQPDLEGLKILQKAHLMQVPFENLDIHNKTPIELNIPQIYKKVVHRNRGGFCYELNGLFFELLQALGFDVKRISGRVYIKENEYSPEYDHMALIVRLNGQEYLTDVGFGEFIFEPLKLDTDVRQNDPGGVFVLTSFEDDYLKINKVEGEKPTPVFIFKNVSRNLKEFGAMCTFHQSNPNSNFMKKRLISKPIENGRITISGNLLKVKTMDMVTEKVLENELEFEKELWNHFQIKIEKPLSEGK